jgi:hypothetical protein
LKVVARFKWVFIYFIEFYGVIGDGFGVIKVTFEDRYLQIKFFIKIILMAGRCLGEGGW